MIWLSQAFAALSGFVEIGGPVVAILLAASVLSVATVIYKVIQFKASRVGRRVRLEQALQHWDQDDRSTAISLASQSKSHLGPLLLQAMQASTSSRDTDRFAERLGALAEDSLARLQSGFRLLDSIAQMAPLLGLFGTVLGMIEAFQSLQNAGSSVDPSLLAGGIWVALMTTAVGLAVAMPTSLLLTWLESQVARERVFTDKALQIILCPASDAQNPSLTYAAA